MNKIRKRPIFLVGGGTGGHLFPLLSVADKLLSRGYNVRILTDRRGVRYLPDKLNIPCHVLLSASPFTGSVFQRLLSLFYLLCGFFQALFLFLFYRPDAIVGFGGYPCSIPFLVGKLFRKPIAGHEQNIILGRVNRFLVFLGGYLALSHENTQKCPSTAKITITGNPMRPDIFNYMDRPYKMSLENDQFNLLIVGGSQGASIFSEIVPLAIANLPEYLRQRLYISQQCRKGDLEKALQVYSQLNIAVELREFFDDIPERMSQSHLVIARAGATSVNEITMIGRPAIFVPLANYSVGDQVLNARRLASVQAAWSVPEECFTVSELVKLLEFSMTRPKELLKVANKARSLRLADGTVQVANFIEGLLADRKEK